MTDKPQTTKRHRDAAKLMVNYWADYVATPVADEPTEDDMALIRRIERVLNGSALFPVRGAQNVE